MQADLTLRLHLEEYVKRNDLGSVHDDGERFLVERDPDTLLTCSSSFVGAGRLPEPRPQDHLPLAPDLAVEITLPESGEELARKIERWLRGGSRAVWVLDPERWQVTCYRPGEAPRVLGVGDSLDGGEVVPGFRIEVARVFGFLSPGALMRIGVPAEVSLLAIAGVLGLIFTGRPFPFELRLELAAVWQGLAATAPLLLFALLSTSNPGLSLSPLRGIHDRLRQVIGPTLCSMRVKQILLLSLAAGVGEEALFRGIIQPELGLLATSAVFGLLHALTPTYFLLAFLMSLYLGWLYGSTENLLVPTAVHALYDAAALWLFRRRFRLETQTTSTPVAT